MALTAAELADAHAIIDRALEEDLRYGPDVTSAATVPADATTVASMVSRQQGVIAGLDIAVLVLDKVIGQLVAVYVAIELIEHVSVGVPLGEILTEKTLFVGIAVQVIIGFGLHRLLRAGHRLGESLSETKQPTFAVAAVLPMPSGETVRSSSPRSSIRLRGPPAFTLAFSL